MRHRHRAGFLRVIDKIALRLQVGGFADDLDRILVGRHRAVRAQAPEHGVLQCACGVAAESNIPIQRKIRDVVTDANRELAFRHGLRQFGKYRRHHARRELLAAEAIASADHARHATNTICRSLGQGCQHILVERLAIRAGFLAAVQHGYRAHAGRQCRQQCIGGKRPI